MSEDFLVRWSRRKRDAARSAPTVELPPAESGEGGTALPGAAPVAPVAHTLSPPVGPAAGINGETAAADALDLADLPSLEDIAGDTPVGAFLRHGVPDGLRREALRRAWTTDPVISTFIEMADYDWDFNAPGGNQVFGPLQAGLDVARMAEEIFAGSPRREPPKAPDPEAIEADADAGPMVDGNEIAASAETDAVAPPASTAQCCDATSLDTEVPGPDALVRLAEIREEPDLVETATPADDGEPPARIRRHGSALPGWK